MDSATVHAGTKCRLEVLEQQREGFRHGHQKPLSIYKQLTSLLTLNFVIKLTKGADGACRDDAGKMKPAVVLWLSEFFPTMCSCSPLNTVDKNGQGFAHSLTGYPPVLANMTGMTIRDRHPKFLATAMSWPRFLYSKYTDDSKNLEKGFLQGTLLLKAYKFIFTSPTSARDVKDNKCGPPSSPSQTSQTFTSQLHKGTSVQFALSNVGSPRSNDGNFDYILFHNNIVDFFESPPGPAAIADIEELLLWWFWPLFQYLITQSMLQKSIQSLAGSSLLNVPGIKEHL
ncbi:hypothetical protein SERLA73DRAFT_149615 [Serpula lacrymans var. lacrymans S7.3]|uniref:Uncharacterized protein n=1 Tax=Serpula lacrymans var. lacrymans (strain S7.3) TaxID=936435 RepID=F8PJM2_SERL3|nr:hypothetical protein SERLA73DRAFT_149615 [Serpula lacrymans var. lacrymans S7.3]